MIRRKPLLARLFLLLAILVTAPAAMAIPDCHAGPMAMAAPHPAPAHSMPHDMPCVGCVAPGTVEPPRLAMPWTPKLSPAPLRAPIGRPIGAPPPANPPPRTA